MRVEGNDLLPLAERHLTDADWAASDAAFLGHTDPMLGAEQGVVEEPPDPDEKRGRHEKRRSRSDATQKGRPLNHRAEFYRCACRPGERTGAKKR